MDDVPSSCLASNPCGLDVEGLMTASFDAGGETVEFSCEDVAAPGPVTTDPDVARLTEVGIAGCEWVAEPFLLR